ncbi:MAG: hypothetical protein QM762_26200 [Chryseolinea sp.]
MKKIRVFFAAAALLTAAAGAFASQLFAPPITVYEFTSTPVPDCIAKSASCSAIGSQPCTLTTTSPQLRQDYDLANSCGKLMWKQ